MIQTIRKYLFGERIKVAEPKEKKYTFSTNEIACIGDRYTYKVVAKSKKEAFKKLVIHFYSPGGGGVSSDIESKHSTLTRPVRDSFTYVGMPYWFARRISGYVRDRETGEDNQMALEIYCRKNGIELDKKS